MLADERKTMRLFSADASQRIVPRPQEWITKKPMAAGISVSMERVEAVVMAQKGEANAEPMVLSEGQIARERYIDSQRLPEKEAARYAIEDSVYQSAKELIYLADAILSPEGARADAAKNFCALKWSQDKMSRDVRIAFQEALEFLTIAGGPYDKADKEGRNMLALLCATSVVEYAAWAAFEGKTRTGYEVSRLNNQRMRYKTIFMEQEEKEQAFAIAIEAYRLGLNECHDLGRCLFYAGLLDKERAMALVGENLEIHTKAAGSQGAMKRLFALGNAISREGMRRDYHAIYEISPWSGGGLKTAPDENAFRSVLARGCDEGVLAHGIGAHNGGLLELVNIMLEGVLRQAVFGRLSGEAVPGVVKDDGPIFVVLEDCQNNRCDKEGRRLSKSLPEDKHLFYIVPDRSYRLAAAKALKDGMEGGLLTFGQALTALSKTLTYDEFVYAPKDSFAKFSGYSITRRYEAIGWLAEAWDG